MDREHAFVVVGCGGLGSAALYWLSRMAAPYATVLGLERRGLDRPGHSRTVGGGRDAPAALLPAAHETWRQVQALSGQALVTTTGHLTITDRAGRGPALDAAAITARWPQFRLTGTERAVYEPRTGIVDTRRADATHVALARGHGAEIREHTPVRAVHDAGRCVEVVTDDEVYRAEHAVVAAGAGTNEVLAGPLPLRVTRERVTRYATPNLIDFSPGRFPAFTWRGFRGFPVHGEVATQLGGPTGGPGPDGFLAERLPGFGGPELGTSTVRRTGTPDGRLVLGTLPSSPRVSVAVGAGPAFTFVSLAGRILAELAATGTTRHPVGDLAPGRNAPGTRVITG